MLRSGGQSGFPHVQPRPSHPVLSAVSYDRCANGRGFHKKLEYVSEEKILSAFGPVLDTVTLKEKKAEEIADLLNKAHVKAQEAKRAQMEGFRVALKELEANEDELYLDLKKGQLDEDAYKRQLARVRGERQRYTQLLEEGQRAVDGAYLVTAQKTLELATRAKSLWESLDSRGRRDLLDGLLSNPQLDGANVRFDLRKPFAVIAKMASSSN